MVTMLRAKAFDLKMLAPVADWLAIGVAVSLPWSTSATGILIVLWLIAALPVLDPDQVRRTLLTPAGGLPVLLWALGVIGMAWSDIPWSERIGALGSFHRLLIIPLLLVQFRVSVHGKRVLYGFLVSALALLVASWALALLPGLTWRGIAFGVPVKDYIFQSEIFLICAFALLGQACDDARAGDRRRAAALVVIAALFLADIFFIAAGRTVLLVVPVLLLLLGGRAFGWRGAVGAAVIGGVVAGVVWFASPYLRARLTHSVVEFEAYRATNADNATAQHLEFLRKSLAIVATAPVFGHGIGSIPGQFRGTVIGQTGASAVPADNPHNQIFAVAIQLGLLGTGVLLAMWAAHALLFCRASLAAWVGLVVVIENIVSSLVNSHLFDFSQGWLYVFGVGVAGGMVLQQGERAAIAAVKP